MSDHKHISNDTCCSQLSTCTDESTQGGITKAPSRAGGLLTNAYSRTANYVSEVIHKFPSLSAGRRAIVLLKKTTTAGVLLFQGKDKVNTLYKLRKANKTLPNDEGSEEVWLGSSSNKASSVKPRTLPAKATANVICVVNKSDIPKLTNGATIPTGPVIDKSHDLLKGRFEHEGLPLDTEEKVAVRLPCVAPVPYESELKTGKLDQATFDSVEATDESFLPFWLEAINNHDAELQALLLAEAALKQFLPSGPPTGHSCVDTPYFKLGQVDDEDELLNPAQEELIQECEELSEKFIANAIEKGTEDAATSSGLSVPVAQIDTLRNDKPSAAPAAPSFTETDHVMARVSIIGMVYDRKTKTVTFPEPSDFMLPIRDLGSKQSQRESVASTLESIQDSLSNTSHYLMRVMDMPILSKVALAFAAEARFSADQITSLDMNSANGFVPVMLLADTLAMAKLKAEAGDEDIAEEALGEHYSKKAKHDTTFTSVNELTGLGSFLSMASNMICFFSLYLKFDVNGSGQMPSQVYYTLQITDKITQRQCRVWFKKNRGEAQKMFYYLANQLFLLFSCYAGATKDVLVLGKALRKTTEGMPTNRFELADGIFDDTMRTVDRVILGSAEAPSTGIWSACPAKKRQDEKEMKKIASLMSPREQTPTKKDKDKERRNSLLPPNKHLKSGGQHEGWLHSETANVNLPPKLFNSNEKMCKSEMRDDTTCPHGKNCRNDHTHFKDLPRDKQIAAVKMVDNNAKLSFVGIDEALLKDLRAEIAKSKEQGNDE